MALRDEVAPGIKFPGWKPNRKLGEALVLPAPKQDKRSGVYYEVLMFSAGPIIKRALTPEEVERRQDTFRQTILKEEPLT